MSRSFKTKPITRRKYFTYDSRREPGLREAWLDEITMEDLHAAKVMASQIKERVENQARA